MSGKSMTEQITADISTVVEHVLADEEHQYGARHKSQQTARLAMRVLSNTFNDLDDLTTLLDLLFYGLAWVAKSRPLTDEEVRAHAAATRVRAFGQMFLRIRQMGAAIERKDWDEVRRLWTELAPYHPFIIGGTPDAEILNVVLADSDAVIKDGAHPPAPIH